MAFTEEEILFLIGEKITIAKPFINKGSQRDGLIHPRTNHAIRGVSQRDSDLEEFPEYYPGYNERVQEYRSILVHTEKAEFPDKLFADPAPNQTEKEFEYYKNNYKNTTRPIFMDYVSVVSMPFHRSNWSINYNEDLEFRQYVEGLPVHGSLENFMKFVVPAIKAKDAEGVLATKPVRIPTTENEDGEIIISETEMVEPIPFYYNVEQVLSYSDTHALILLHEKSIVHEGSRKMKAGLIFEFYDDEAIYRIVQVGERKDFEFSFAIKYTHECGRLPVHKLKGVPVYMEDHVLWQSPFLYSVPNLDLVLINQNNLQAVINKCVYPYRIMLGDRCEFEDTEGNQCNNGYIRIHKENGYEQTTCPDCNGSGLKSRVSKLGEMLFAAPEREDNGEASINQPLMQYVSPNVDTPKFLREEILENETRARQILHLNTTNQTAQPSSDITATAKAIDLKAKAAFVSPISMQYFELYRELLLDIGCIRFGNDFEQPTITEPVTFDFSTEMDYVERLKEALDADAPPIVIRQIVMQFLETIYFSEEQQGDVFNLITKTDQLLGVKSDRIALKIQNGTAEKWQEVLHSSPTTLIDELVMENPNFFEQEFRVQQEQLIAKAQEKVQSQDPIDAIVGTQ